jgi:hypothetical protein
MTTVRRPFNWGIVMIMGDDWLGELPEIRPDVPVSANERAIIVLVRHAQDSGEIEGDYVKLAETEVVVRRLDEPAAASDSRREVFRGEITTPTGRVSIGDADDWTTAPAHPGANLVVVSVDARLPLDDLSPDAVQVDLLPGQAAVR